MVCPCKIENGEIVFCALHDRARALLNLAEYLQTFLRTAKLADEFQANTLREVIMPHITNQIREASKDIPAAGWMSKI